MFKMGGRGNPLPPIAIPVQMGKADEFFFKSVKSEYSKLTKKSELYGFRSSCLDVPMNDLRMGFYSRDFGIAASSGLLCNNDLLIDPIL